MKRIFAFALAFFFIYVFNEIGLTREIQHNQRAKTVPGVVVAKVKQGISISALNGLSAGSSRRLAISAIEKIFPEKAKTDLSRIYKIKFPESIRPEEFAAGIFDPDIFEYVEPKYISYIEQTTPDDPLASSQFHLAQINLLNGWDIQKGNGEIVIAIVDNGTDFRHPDLAPNIRINMAEATGIAGVDDDGNSFVDDFYGWDFGENDNDPSHGTDESKIAVHGTHTAGIASAVTNNSEGVAGVSWNCAILPVKVSTDDETYQIPYGYEGIVYAADNGAHIINNSWGRSGAYSQYEQDIIDYAVENGSIVIAAGGNTNRQTNFYPAGYVHVVAVAAVNEDDEKTSYSTFGEFIDVTAPGGDNGASRPGILSTYPVEWGSYGQLSGSSMASPIVAGLMGLLMNRFPEFDPLQLKRQLILTTDDIDALNPDFTGLLGSGRVNAYRALTEDVQEEMPAKIDFFKAAAYDSLTGNGNFLFERGEEIGLDVWYRNYAISPARNFEVTLTSDDDAIIITDGLADVSQIPPDMLYPIQKSLRFRIKSTAEPHLAELAFHYNFSNGIGGSDTISVIIGKRAVLFVDDDDGFRNVEEFYFTALNSLHIPYLVWNHSRLGTPPARTLTHFPMIIWACEWAFPSLNPTDRIAIQYYLNAGGNLFISGQDIGWDLADPDGAGNNQYSESSRDFYQNYLHSLYQDDNSQSSFVRGMPGTIGQGMEFDIYQPGIPVHFQFPEWIEPMPDAVSCFRYDSDKGAGVFFAEDHSVLNLGFGFEAVDATRDADPLMPSRTRTELMRRVVNTLGPVKHQPLSDSELSPDSLRFAVKLSPLVSDWTSLSLFWKTDTMADFEEITMGHTSDFNFSKTMKTPSYSGKISYYFKLVSPYFQQTLPLNGASEPFSFFIGTDRSGPTFHHTSLRDVFLQNTPRPVRVFVEDNIEVDTNSVWLHYHTPIETDSVQLKWSAENSFTGAMPPVIPIGDSVRYYFTASDAAKTPNRTESAVYSFHVGFEDFERGLEFWTADSNSWGLDNNESFSGSSCISTFPGRSYENNTNVSLKANGAIKRRELKDLILHFRTKYSLETAGDFGYTEVSLDSGNTWQTLGKAVTGEQKPWEQIFMDLNPFATDGDEILLLRFRLETDSTQSAPMSGWFIDDIRIETRVASKIVDENIDSVVPFHYIVLHPSAPNPFNAVTSIRFETSVPGEVNLEIFNVRGQVVFNRMMNLASAGRHQILWDGRDARGLNCGSGIYFARLIAKQSNRTQTSNTIKLIYLR